MRVISPKQMQELERITDKKGLSYEELMGNAGNSLAEEIHKLGVTYDITNGIVFLCGKGNNGGDGFVSAKKLHGMGYDVTIALICGFPTTDIAIKALLNATNVKVVDDISAVGKLCKNTSVVVDCVFGTGFHGKLHSSIALLFNQIPTGTLKISADVPSGGNALTGTISENTFKADYTYTFGYMKLGMVQQPLLEYCGHTEIIDIGIVDVAENQFENNYFTTDKDTVKSYLPKRNALSHKGTYGNLLNVMGSVSMSGACAMSAKAALRSGCGLLTIATARTVVDRLSSSIFEPVYISLKQDSKGFITTQSLNILAENISKYSCVAIGCGLGVTTEIKELVKFLIKEVNCPIVLDADGINCICTRIDIIKDAKSSIILTPHPVEFARLIGCTVSEVMSDRVGYASSFAKKHNVIVLLKGSCTVIASPAGEVYINTTGNPGMSRGGSGDVLTGIIGALCAQKINPFHATIAGAYIHGLAGDIAAQRKSIMAMLPTDIIEFLPEVFLSMDR